jgi:hypothetical protein
VFLVILIMFVAGEKQELLDEVQAEWEKRQVEFSSDDEDNFDENEECVTKVNPQEVVKFVDDKWHIIKNYKFCYLDSIK